MKRLLFFVLIIFTFFSLINVGAVFAGIPSSVSGTVYVQLPTGERLPTVGIKVVRTDFDSFNYCESGQRCFGTKHSVYVETGSAGDYKMGNAKTAPNISCFQKIPAGDRYACAPQVVDNKGSTEISECPRDLLKNYSSIYDQGFNWCGFYGFSNPHRYQPIFDEGAKLPGNLDNLGYSVKGGAWKTVDQNDPNRLLDAPYYEDMLGSYADLYRRDFVFVLEPLNELEVNSIEFSPKSTNDFAGCKSLVGIASKDGVEYPLTALPSEFSGSILLTCIAEVKGADASRIDFTFEKNIDGSQSLDSRSVAKKDLVLLSSCRDGFVCYSATAEFLVEGVGNYKVDSRVCNENNLCSK